MAEETHMNKKTYTKSILCDNCIERSKFEVPKGTPGRDFAKELKCPNCGCDMVGKRKTGGARIMSLMKKGTITIEIDKRG